MKKAPSKLDAVAKSPSTMSPLEMILAQKETIEKAREFVGSLHHLGDAARLGTLEAVRLLHEIAVISTQHLNNLPTALTGHLARNLSAWPQMRFIHPTINCFQDSRLKALGLGSQTCNLYNKRKALSEDHPFNTLAASLHELVEVILQTAVVLRGAGQATIHENVSVMASQKDSHRVLGELVQGIQECFNIVGLAIPPESLQQTKLSPEVAIRWIEFMGNTITIAKKRQLSAYWRFSWLAILRATNGQPELSRLGSTIRNWSKHKDRGSDTQFLIFKAIRQRLKKHFLELSNLTPKVPPQRRKRSKPLRINRPRAANTRQT